MPEDPKNLAEAAAQLNDVTEQYREMVNAVKAAPEAHSKEFLLELLDAGVDYMQMLSTIVGKQAVSSLDILEKLADVVASIEEKA